jgi:hypothetical protein
MSPRRRQAANNQALLLDRGGYAYGSAGYQMLYGMLQRTFNEALLLDNHPRQLFSGAIAEGDSLLAVMSDEFSWGEERFAQTKCYDVAGSLNQSDTSPNRSSCICGIDFIKVANLTLMRSGRKRRPEPC